MRLATTMLGGRVLAGLIAVNVCRRRTGALADLLAPEQSHRGRGFGRVQIPSAASSVRTVMKTRISEPMLQSVARVSWVRALRYATKCSSRETT